MRLGLFEIIIIIAMVLTYIVLMLVKARASKQDRTNNTFEIGQLQATQPSNVTDSTYDTITLIVCPACGRQISNQATTCPGCGHPFTAKKVRVHFWRKQNMLSGVANTGTVIVDGIVVGSAANGTEFDVMLTIGSHNIVIDSKTTGIMQSGRTNGTTITIPNDAKSADVELKLKNDAMSFIGTGGMSIVVGEVKIHR